MIWALSDVVFVLMVVVFVLAMRRFVPRVVRPSTLWERLAASHPRAALAVVVAEFAAFVGLSWVDFGVWGGLVAVASLVAAINVMMGLVRWMRRRRGLPPLPSLWRKTPG